MTKYSAVQRRGWCIAPDLGKLTVAIKKGYNRADGQNVC